MAVNYNEEPQFNSSGNVYVDVSDVVSGFYRFANFTKAACKRAAKEYAEDTEQYMKREAPWNDVDTNHSRAGDARRGLKAEYFEQGIASSSMNDDYSVGVRLSHGVSYGLYLEYNGLIHPSYLSRRRPILVPTLESKQPLEFLNKIRAQFAKIHKV